MPAKNQVQSLRLINTAALGDQIRPVECMAKCGNAGEEATKAEQFLSPSSEGQTTTESWIFAGEYCD